MRKNPLVTHPCGVCMGLYPETELELQWLYGRDPWFVCHNCFAAGLDWANRKQPDAAFEVVMEPTKRDEALTLEFDPFADEEEEEP